MDLTSSCSIASSALSIFSVTLSTEMDSEQQAAEVRRIRLQWAEPGTGAAGESAVEGTVQEPSRTSGVGNPVASSTLLTSVPNPSPSTDQVHSSARGSLVCPTATPGNSDDTATLIVINGRSVKELLECIQRSLAAGSPQLRILTPSCSLEKETTTAAATTPHPPCGASACCARKPSSGSAEVQVISSDESSDRNQKNHEATVRRSKLKPRLSEVDWRSLPSTSRAGFGDDKSSSLKKRRPGRPKGSKSKLARPLESSDSGSSIDDPESDNNSEVPAVLSNHNSQRRLNFNWRESLPSSSTGLGKENKPLPVKRRPGRPKGSKNKSTKSQESCTSESMGLSCHICREGSEGGAFCLTDCGHLFHKKCIDRWLSTSSQKYKTLKTCPYCGGNFQTSIPFYG